LRTTGSRETHDEIREITGLGASLRRWRIERVKAGFVWRFFFGEITAVDIIAKMVN